MSDFAAPVRSNNPRLHGGICLFLALIVWVVFGQTRHFPFINYDDDQYVYQNNAVTHGLTSWGAASAFNWNASDNWVPLTTLSHMLDWQIYGSNAGGHHLTNVLFHAVTVILLFLVLARMTGAVWRSAFVAAVFAIHPLRAESVVWIAERKDVLCGVFFMLTLLMYWNYVCSPRSLCRYLLALIFYALALMSKPVVVTLPILLLLLDYWPLQRIGWNGLPGSGTIRNPQPAIRILLEKIPFLLLSLASCIPTMLAERPGIGQITQYPLFLRIENALVSCVAYIWQLFYPARLALPYPYPSQGLPALEVAGALAFLIIITFAVFHYRQKHPYLLVGWLWYLVMLLPVIGLVQVGEQARADRHTYLSQIGLDILLTWLVADLFGRFRQRFLVLASLSSLTSLILAALIWCGYQQTAYWKDSVTLWTHVLASTSLNPSAYQNLGYAYETEGRLDDAIAEYRQLLQIKPDYTLANHSIGNLRLQQGRFAEAITQFEQALKFDQGRDAAQDYNELAQIFFRLGQRDNAITAYQSALKLDPGNAAAANSLARAFLAEGRLENAVVPCEMALKIQPNNVGLQSNLARIIWTLARTPQVDGDRVLSLAQGANQISGGNNPLMLRALAAAYARCGQFPNAIATANRALALALMSPPDFINSVQQEMALYQAGSPLPMLNQTNATNKP